MPESFNPLHCGAVVASSPTSASARIIKRFNPLHCGAVVASQRTAPSARRSPRSFQSPSLRGSGRFLSRVGGRAPGRGGFNPLHCGAVVASKWRRARRPRHGLVSIPFIAGQWSLRAAEEKARKEAERFNPLHCGAVVASPPKADGGRGLPRVSIPFIAGQWSLPCAVVHAAATLARSFQSPSLRGSGRF